jgi:hypothetical protein
MTGISSRALRLLLVVGAILAVAAGVSYATALATRTASPAVIHGCYLNKIGTLRVIDPATQHCLAVETPIEWNQTGPAGPAGPKGDPGVSSLDALNGAPCTLVGHSGQAALLFNGVDTSSLQENIACVTTDPSEPNNTQAAEAPFGFSGMRTLYPAGDEDWYRITGTPFSIGVFQAKTGTDSIFNAPIHIEIYDNGVIAASGDGQVYFNGVTSGHTYEVHVTGAGPAVYSMNAF